MLAKNFRAEQDRHLAKFRAAAYAQFRDIKVHSTERKYCFDGATAAVISESENLSRGEEKDDVSYMLTCFARNVEGEYFMFISNEDCRPFFKHVSHSNAKIALGGKYVAPD